MTPDELERIVDSHVAQLREHCDSVVIVVTRHPSDAEGTASLAKGAGNWHARYGSLQEAVERMDEMLTANEDD